MKFCLFSKITQTDHSGLFEHIIGYNLLTAGVIGFVMSKFPAPIATACLITVIVVAVFSIAILAYAQHQTNFIASLTGKNTVPPVDTSNGNS